MWRSERITLHSSDAGDLAYVLAAERHPDNAPYLLVWSEAEHREAMQDPSVLHAVARRDNGTRIGYVILRGLDSPHRCLELLRLTITEKGQGLGRETLRLITRLAFEEHGAHRLWLDVMEHNHRARRLYESEGFEIEGVARECLWLDGRWVSLVLMAKLEGQERV